jgi:hypothetical protein
MANPTDIEELKKRFRKLQTNPDCPKLIKAIQETEMSLNAPASTTAFLKSMHKAERKKTIEKKRQSNLEVVDPQFDKTVRN